MTPDIRHLITTGHLMATERAQIVPHQPPMMCAICEERPVDLIWGHTPYTVQELTRGKSTVCECGKVHGKLIPGMVWGEDVTVVCPCCSVLALLGKCPHRAVSRG